MKKIIGLFILFIFVSCGAGSANGQGEDTDESVDKVFDTTKLIADLDKKESELENSNVDFTDFTLWGYSVQSKANQIGDLDAFSCSDLLSDLEDYKMLANIIISNIENDIELMDFFSLSYDEISEKKDIAEELIDNTSCSVF